MKLLVRRSLPLSAGSSRGWGDECECAHAGCSICWWCGVYLQRLRPGDALCDGDLFRIKCHLADDPAMNRKRTGTAAEPFDTYVGPIIRPVDGQRIRASYATRRPS